jgi:ribulose-5-phosphate 4-epimerase/fuculose-1-phosphate aldolase
MDMNEGICNHLTVMVPGTTDRFLCVPYGLLWSEVTASNLLLVNENGDVLEGTGEIDSTAFHIHKAIHKRGVVAVLHTHQPYATALCCTDAQDGGFKLEMCHQNSLRFWNEIAYDDEFNGLVLDDDEGERLVKVMNGRRILMHQSHGIIVCGASVAEAFDDLYYLERAARQQILAQSTGKKLKLVGDDVAMGFKNDCEDDGAKSKWANLHYDALKRGLMRGPGRIFCSADYIFPNAAVELIFLVWFSRAAYLFVDELKEHIVRA